MRTAHPRDDAEAARMIAAFGDFEIGGVARREPKARGGKIRDVARVLVNLQQRLLCANRRFGATELIGAAQRLVVMTVWCGLIARQILHDLGSVLSRFSASFALRACASSSVYFFAASIDCLLHNLANLLDLIDPHERINFMQ